MINIKYFKYIYGTLLLVFTCYLLLDTFLIGKVYSKAQSNDNAVYNLKQDDIVSNDTSYKDDNIEINVTSYREYDTDIYVADVVINNSNYLKTAFAHDSYGKNIVDKTSNISNDNNAILSINGDYYGVQEYGYVLKNGVIYRSTGKSNQEDLVIYKDGSFEIINESELSLEELLNRGAYNILSFGPSLINNDNITVSTNSEVGKAMRSNPRTAIGIIDSNHYVFVVSDGRTSNSVGLSLYNLATFMKKINCKIAYNLDGGGSSTMYFNGKVINNPTTNGNRISERSVSDIVYIGY